MLRLRTVMTIERKQLLDFLESMREAEVCAKQREHDHLFLQAEICRARARAFNEVYTELKRSGFGSKH